LFLTKLETFTAKSPQQMRHLLCADEVCSLGLLLCEHFYYFIFAVIMSLLLQVLMMSIKVFHCMWRHMLLTVEKKTLSALPQLHRHCRTTAYQVMNVRSTHNQHITGQWIIEHSIINLNRIWYIWSRFWKLYSIQYLILIHINQIKLNSFYSIPSNPLKV